MKSVVLTSPNTSGSYRSASINDENLALGYLAAVLERDGYDVEIIDARMNHLSPESVLEQVRRKQPLFLGVSMISEESVSWVKVLGSGLKQIKSIRHICAGGYYPSLQSEKVLYELDFVDSVANGEGEATILDLLQRIESGKPWKDVHGITIRLSGGSIVVNSRRPLVANLDNLPWPKRYGGRNISEVLIEGSRGCFGRCNFCAVRPHLRTNSALNWRGRTPENIISEILWLRKSFPSSRKYRFIDPDFFGSSSDCHSQRILKLASLIEKEAPGIEIFVEGRVVDIRRRDVLLALKRAGLKEIYIGVESGSNRILGLMNKHVFADEIINATQLLNELGINYQYGHMMVTPWTEYDDIVSSLSLLQIIGRVQFDKLFNELYVIPGTDLMEQAARCCRLVREAGTGYYSYEMGHLVKNIRSFGLSFETRFREFSEEVWLLYKNVQRHEQCRIIGAGDMQRKLSSLFIEIFRFCLEKSKHDLLSDSEIYDIAEKAIDCFRNRIDSIKKLLDPSVTFIKQETASL